jgi:phospho-N-acetylmuramoyl-pentapeptide-transferase
MLELLVSDLSTLHATGFAVAFVLTVLLIRFFGKKLPKDQGRKFAVEGALSEGKGRGAGIIFVCVFAAVSCLFALQTLESCIYLLFILFAMITGFLDDASDKAWKDYKKAVYDLITSVGITVVYIIENGTGINLALLGIEIELPVWLFGLFSVTLIWASINVTNCTDGVDGLSATLGIVTLISFTLYDSISAGSYGDGYTMLLFCACLMGYLLFNAHPSTILMGDAGSRAMGTVIAIAALKSRDPFLLFFFGIVFVFDGGLGLIKLFLARFFKIKILKNIRTPLHDHVRKNLNWSNTQTVYRFTIIQSLVSVIALWFSGHV